ncbi:N-acetylmuramoyl-L-alanine amidase [Edaphobacter modestus]|uniref:N-acetylmuramoyl-L-alanine amidase n=1 Tax=Edaphobacter modestus TaxID=388466 RepID=A0A4Q7YX45_9BACT|nr:N-acetylmuramoyl-L-alanine amidase [Edaphobacter modestus]RZU41994.1 N-acetylmuramoyl-L-alanine amidase [Edaphobacter modestus]
MLACNKLRSIGVWCAVCAAGLSCVGFAGATPSKTKNPSGTRHAAPLSPWEKATQGRDTLEAIPADRRTREDYARALDRFRDIYHENPRSQYAAAAINAAAELLAEQGRDLQDEKSLKDAVGQYEFLRKQYPGSSLRVSALLAEAQLYENALHDPASAREKYSLFVKQYPGSPHVEEAKAGLASLDQSARTQAASAVKNEAKSSKPRTAKIDRVPGTAITPPSDSETSSLAPMPTTGAAASDAMQRSTSRGVSPSTGTTRSSLTPGEPADPQASILHVAATAGQKRGELAQVTGIRHWSTPNYTRVAIDLGDDVTYEAARVPNPDRIYFDLHGTRLAQSLVGKSFTVTDDGFLKQVRAAQFSNDVTRVVLDVNDVTEYSAFLLPNPYRLIIDIHGSSLPSQVAGNRATAPLEEPSQQGSLNVPAPRTEPEMKTSSRHPVPNTVATSSAATTTDVAAVSSQPGKEEATRVPTSNPISAVVPGGKTPSSSGTTATRNRRSKVAAPDPAAPARAAAPTADGQTSLVRALGLKIGRIVIDAGHGGHDSGTIGVDGLEEKDVVLDVALRLGKLLHERLGSEIIYTRSDDTFIPLETRTAIANKAQADLFLSIHANSSSDSSARGVETYYLNFTSQPDALQVAARENAVSDQSIYQLSDLVKKIALKEKIDESREFASDVEANLYAGLQRGNEGLKNRGVKKAPFVVLIGANMPSVLAEISFVTNPKDAGQLRQPAYRQRVAESLYKGVAKYEDGLSASKSQVEQASSRGGSTPQ